MEGSGFKSLWWWETRPALEPTQPPVQRLPILFSGVNWLRRGSDHPPHTSAQVKNRRVALLLPCMPIMACYSVICAFIYGQWCEMENNEPVDTGTYIFPLLVRLTSPCKLHFRYCPPYVCKPDKKKELPPNTASLETRQLIGFVTFSSLERQIWRHQAYTINTLQNSLPKTLIPANRYIYRECKPKQICE
jgi:hypothetical protein